MAETYSVPLSQVVSQFDLKIAWRSTDYDKIRITVADVARPGLQIAGYFDHFEPMRLQVIGNVESSYLDKMTSAERTHVYDRIFSYKIPAIIAARNLVPGAECLQMAKKHNITILRTGAQDGDVVLFCHLKAFSAGNQVPGGDDGGDLVAEDPIVNVCPLGGGHLVEIARFHIADDLQPHGLKMVEISGDLQTGPGHIRNGDPDLVIIRGTPGDLQIELRHHLGKGDRVSFGHFATSDVHIDTIIQRRAPVGNPKKIIKKF